MHKPEYEWENHVVIQLTFPFFGCYLVGWFILLLLFFSCYFKELIIILKEKKGVVGLFFFYFKFSNFKLELRQKKIEILYIKNKFD